MSASESIHSILRASSSAFRANSERSKHGAQSSRPHGGLFFAHGMVPAPLSRGVKWGLARFGERSEESSTRRRKKAPRRRAQRSQATRNPVPRDVVRMSASESMHSILRASSSPFRANSDLSSQSTHPSRPHGGLVFAHGMVRRSVGRGGLSGRTWLIYKVPGKKARQVLLLALKEDDCISPHVFFLLILQ